MSASDYTTRDAVIELLLEHPELMQRPVIFRGERAVIARPSEKVLELLRLKGDVVAVITDELVRDEVRGWLADNWDPELTLAEWWERLRRVGLGRPHLARASGSGRACRASSPGS